METVLDLLEAASNAEGNARHTLRLLLDKTEIGGVTKTEVTSEGALKVWAQVMKAEGLQVMASTNMVRAVAVGDRTIYVSWRTV